MPTSKKCQRVMTITLNPAIDRTVQLESFLYGDINRAVSSREEMGGKGINVARMLGLDGTETIATGLIGHENSRLTETLMDSEPFQTEWIEVPGKTRTNTKLATLDDQKTTDLNEPGFNLEAISKQIMEKIDFVIKKLVAEYDIVVFAGSIPPGLPEDIYGHMSNVCRAGNPDCFIVVDAEGQALRAALEAGVDMIKPNLAELASVTDLPIDRLEDQHEAIKTCQKLMVKYNLTTILLSNGQRGSFLLNSTGDDKQFTVLHSQALSVTPVSTTGAGDSLLAGYLSARCQGMGDKECLARASACAALAVGRQSWRQLTSEAIVSKTELALPLVKYI